MIVHKHQYSFTTFIFINAIVSDDCKYPIVYIIWQPQFPINLLKRTQPEANFFRLHQFFISLSQGLTNEYVRKLRQSATNDNNKVVKNKDRKSPGFQKLLIKNKGRKKQEMRGSDFWGEKTVPTRSITKEELFCCALPHSLRQLAMTMES